MINSRVLYIGAFINFLLLVFNLVIESDHMAQIAYIIAVILFWIGFSIKEKSDG